MNTIGIENRFVIETRFGSSQVVFGVAGEVDSLTAPLLTSALGALVDRGNTDLVVDLSKVKFIDAAGLGVSVSLIRHGKLATVAATDETILQMDRDQYATGQGPCVSAAIDGAFGQRDQELADMFASDASAILAESHVDVMTDQRVGRLQGALRVREAIAQAQGVIMARRGVPAELASAELGGDHPLPYSDDTAALT